MRITQIVVFMLTILIFCVITPADVIEAENGTIKRNPELVANPLSDLKTISLDLKGMDIVDVLNLLAKRGDLNIVVGSDVRGKVTIFLKEVDIWDALEIILASNNLAYEKRGNIVNVMTERDYELLYGQKYHDKKEIKVLQLKYAKAADVSQSLNQVKTNLGKIVVDGGSNTIVLIDVPERVKQMERMVFGMDVPTATEVFILNYAKANDIKDKLTDLLTAGVGNIKVDERMNKIVVTDLPEKVKEIGEMVVAFDEKTPQVLIESKIVEISLDESFGLGINWDLVLSGVGATISGDIDISGVTNTSPTAKLTVASLGGDTATIDLLETMGKTNILSSPHITVANNHEAKVLVGTKEVYITSTVTTSDGTTTTADNVQFVDVGVTLSVTPTINKDGFITMKIRPEVSSVSDTVETYETRDNTKYLRSRVPIVTTSETETTVLIKDGTTIIIAGLMKDKQKTGSKKIPVLGDLPLLGGLFRSKGEEKVKTELAILLTPHIITGDSSFTDIQRDIPEMKKQNVEPKVTVKTENQDSKEGNTGVTWASDYSKYLHWKIYQSIQSNYPKGTSEGEVILSFTLSSNGYLKGEPKVLNEVDENLGEFAIQTIKNVVPFPPFPENLNKPEMNFKISVLFQKR